MSFIGLEHDPDVSLLSQASTVLQGARAVGGRHVGIFWTLTGLLIFLWCARTPHLPGSSHAAWPFRQ